MKSTIRTVSVSALVLAAAVSAGCSAEEEAEAPRSETPAASTTAAPVAEEQAMAEEPAEAEAETETAEAEPMQIAMAEEAPAEAEMPAAEEAEAPAEAAPMEVAQADTGDAGGEMTQAAASGELPADHPALGGDPAAGKRVFIKCMSCHAVKEGQNRVGPSLYGIIGRPAGSVDKFNYSDANANSGIVWTKDVLFEYLENPQEYIPGTRMVFPGLPKEEDRRNVIAYLESVSEE